MDAQAAQERVADRFLSMKRQLGTALQGVIDFTCTKVGCPGCTVMHVAALQLPSATESSRSSSSVHASCKLLTEAATDLWN